ncbi:MAG: diguanylate cyclase [Anaerophaga sp.]|nr:diguanylate cyclase [Eubacteriaceae bacterium]MDK2937128.1 diguanylate cyclase [Eubacteriaceae bacterium]MDN5291507.1 diguanylate cyclase [Anaerophaga sp.]
MKQMSFMIESQTELKSIRDELNANEAFLKAQSVLLHIFSPYAENELLENWIMKINYFFGDIKIVGTTAGGMISNNEISFEAIELVFFIFEKSDFEIKTYDLNVLSVEEVRNDLIDLFSNIDHIAGVEFLTTLKTNKYISLLDLISENINFPLFGAGAWCVVFDENTLPKIFNEDIYDDSIVVIVYYGEELHIKSDYCLGWVPLGKEMTVTSMDGDYCINEIDGKPAVSIYEKYLKVKPDSHFFEHISIFPMAIIREGRLIARTPINYDKQGRLFFNADVHIDDRIRLSYGNFSYILKDSREMSEKFSEFNAQSILLFSCRNRLNFFGEKAMREVEIYNENSLVVSGYYSASEIISKDNKINVLNSSLVAVAMREGDVNLTYNCDQEKIVSNQSREQIPYLDRLLNFLEVTTQELEESNRKLEKLATSDGLTGLYNRRGLEQLFTYEMNKRTDNQNLAVIMCDVDFFKKVNDKYGHNIGDTVLKGVGHAIEKCIRSQDSAGRWGGEEFMVLLPNTKLKIAKSIAQRICKTIAELNFEIVGSVTVSAGVAVSDDETLMENVYHKADTALYIAKKNGRNRVEVFREDTV